MVAPRHFTPADWRRLHAADLAFTRYNTERSLRLEDGVFETRAFGEAIAARDLTREAAYYSRVIGLNEAALPQLDAIIGWYHDAGRPAAVTLTPERATLLGPLADRGFRLRESQTFLVTHRDEHVPVDSTVHIHRASEADLDAVFDLWAGPDDDPVPVAARLRRTAAQLVPEFSIYLARLDGEPAAMATTYYAEGIAWLGNANTQPSFQRRGCQLGLLQRRLQDAWARGCDWAITDTAFGTSSQRNAERAGMRLAFMSYELVLPVAPT